MCYNSDSTWQMTIACGRLINFIYRRQKKRKEK
nr:MAG TPA: hypothetical protein [Caudoviricetes sp.]